MYEISPCERLYFRLTQGKPDTYGIFSDPDHQDSNQLVLVNQGRIYPLVEFTLLLTYRGQRFSWTEKDFCHELLLQITNEGHAVFTIQQLDGASITTESSDYIMKIIAFADVNQESKVPFSLYAHCSNMRNTPKRASGAAMLYQPMAALWHDDMIDLIAAQSMPVSEMRGDKNEGLDGDDGQSARW